MDYLSKSGLFWIGLMVSTAIQAGAPSVTLDQMQEYNIPEANQGIGVDKNYFYAVDNRTIAKYDKKTGLLVAKFEDKEGGPFIHMDSAVVVDGKIYASHSNWRQLPMTSSVEIFDAETLQHVGTHSFGRGGLGSFTWLDFHEGFWWGTFANYDRLGPDGQPYGGKMNTTLAKFDKDFKVLETWIYPESLLSKFDLMSNSGGSWGPDGYLYITGHDLSEVYKVQIPKAGSMVEVVETIPFNIRGQGIAWDRSEPGVLYGIIRATDDEEEAGMTNRVVVARSNILPIQR